MMLECLCVENFKAWEKLDIKLGRVTGLFGTNSSGNSSVLQFLLMLKQTKNATDRGVVLDFGGPNNQHVNLGGYRDAIHDHDLSRVMKWDLGWTLPSKATITDPSKKRTHILAADTRLQINSTACLQGGLLLSDVLKYSFGGFDFSISPKKEGGTEYQLVANSPVANDFRFVRNKQRAWALPGPVKTHLFPDQAKTYFQNAEFLSLPRVSGVTLTSGGKRKLFVTTNKLNNTSIM